MKQVRHFIEGEFVESVDGATFDSISPIDNQPVAVVAEGGADDVDRAVRAAAAAFDLWSTMSPTARKRILLAVADGIVRRADELARWETIDMGKPIVESRHRDVPRAAYNFRFFADYAEMVGTRAFDKRWDNTFGYTVVAKPAEQSPITASILAEICTEAGLPDGVFNVVNGFGPGSAGEALTRHPGVAAVTFTGESNTGKAIMAAAANTLKKLSFELGGKSASIVFADADLDEAVAGSLIGTFMNQGEACLAGSRILVQRSIYEEFCSRLVAGVRAWK